jgi:hypothetical protein
MTLKETMKQLESLGNETMRAHDTKDGAGDNQLNAARIMVLTILFTGFPLLIVRLDQRPL